METTVTNSSNPTRTATRTPSGRDRLGGLFGRKPDDGTLGSKVKVDRALKMAGGSATRFDVRESRQWRSGHAPGAIHVPRERHRQGRTADTPRRLAIVMCANGVGSRAAAKYLREIVWEATSLSVPMMASQRAGGEVRR
jgi:rhodanese-related sulfurtransferase